MDRPTFWVYEGECLRRAFADIRVSIGAQAWENVPVFLAGLIVYAALFGVDAAGNELIIWAIFGVLGVVIWLLIKFFWHWARAPWRIYCDVLANPLVAPTKQSDLRLNLARLRTSGVQLRNAAQRIFPDQQTFETWNAEIHRWKDDVVSAIAEVDQANAEWFSTLDFVPPPRISIQSGSVGDTYKSLSWGQDQVRLFSHHDYRLLRLDQLLQKMG